MTTTRAKIETKSHAFLNALSAAFVALAPHRNNNPYLFASTYKFPIDKPNIPP